MHSRRLRSNLPHPTPPSNSPSTTALSPTPAPPGAPQERSLLHYRVAFRGHPLIADSELDLFQGQTTLGSHLRQTAVRTFAAD